MAILDSINQHGVGLRVEFRRQDDRYAHQVCFINGGEAIPFLQSIEGISDELWPASPPLQQLTIENRPGGQTAALLLGMAGKSHWSLAVLAGRSQAEITFDTACRINEGPEGLGATYLATGEYVQHGDHLLWRFDEHQCRLRPDRNGGALHFSTLPDQPGLLQVVPLAKDWRNLSPTTLRWRYTVRVERI